MRSAMTLAGRYLVFAFSVALLGTWCSKNPTRPEPVMAAPEADVAPPPANASSGIWIASSQLSTLPEAGPAWDNVTSHARRSCGVPNLSDQNDPVDVCILAKALVFARIGDKAYRDDVMSALKSVAHVGYQGRALSLGRELAAYVVSADLIDLKHADPGFDQEFRSAISSLLTTPTADGPANLIDCHEMRPNNWGTHCGASRAAVAAYLGDVAQLARVAQVFRGWLGDRASYAGFKYGDLSWQCDPASPVGINPAGCVKNGHSIDGVLPDDQRRAGGFKWPPP